MVFVAGHIAVEPKQRESYLTGWVSIAEQARRAAGCLESPPICSTRGRINTHSMGCTTDSGATDEIRASVRS